MVLERERREHDYGGINNLGSNYQYQILRHSHHSFLVSWMEVERERHDTLLNFLVFKVHGNGPQPFQKPTDLLELKGGNPDHKQLFSYQVMLSRPTPPTHTHQAVFIGIRVWQRRTNLQTPGAESLWWSGLGCRYNLI